MPCSSRKADSGDSVGPSVRIVSMRSLHREAEVAEVSWKMTPW
jgi:hypothetical protein